LEFSQLRVFIAGSCENLIDFPPLFQHLRYLKAIAAFDRLLEKSLDQCFKTIGGL